MANSTVAAGTKVVSRAEWLAANREFLNKEKELTRLRDRLSRERQELPWVRVEKEYVFDTPGGKKTLGELFGGRSQLAIYHFMFGPEWEQGCPSCSLVADQIEGSAVHLGQRDVRLVLVSRAPLEKIAAFKKRMGWKLPWASSFGSEFNHDFNVSLSREELAREDCYNFGSSGFPSDEAPGLSVFYKNERGEIFRTYSAYGRGLEVLLPMYMILDRAPKGRDEEGLAFSMAWVRHHDRYEGVEVVEEAAASGPAKAAGAGCCAEHS
jgi:predicted dithiol-disulfide oxidoreductase (DUF899 family)